MPRIHQVALVEPRQAGIHVFFNVVLPRLGLPILATQLARLGLKARVFVENMAPVDWKYVGESDAVFLSATTSTVNRAYELAARVKAENPETITVIGGPHVTFLPEEALATGAIDYVFRGEADHAMPELIAVMEGELEPQKCAGLSFLRDGIATHAPGREFIANLDAVGSPDFTLLNARKRMRIMPMEFSRGCPHNCDFCAVVRMFGRRCRQQSIEAALDQLERKRFTETTLGLKPSYIFIYDDNHTADRAWAKELWETATSRGLLPPAIAMQTRADVTQDRELMRILARARCKQFFWGIESIDNQTLAKVGKHQTIEDVEAALRSAKAHGMRIHGMLVVGFDGDTPQSILQTSKWAIRQDLDTVQIMILTPLPGTPVYERMEAEGRLLSTNWDHYDAHHVTFRPQRMSPLQLQLATFKAMGRFYSWAQIAKVAGKWRWATAYLRHQGHKLLRDWRHARETHRFVQWLRSLDPLGRSQSGLPLPS